MPLRRVLKKALLAGSLTLAAATTSLAQAPGPYPVAAPTALPTPTTAPIAAVQTPTAEPIAPVAADTPITAVPWQWSAAPPQSTAPENPDVVAISYQKPDQGGENLSELQNRLADIEKRLKTPTAPAPPKPEEYPNFRITGFTQFDTAYYEQDGRNIAALGNAQDGSGFRRARLAANGKVAEFTSWQIEMDFATAGRPSFFDTYVRQANLPFFDTITIGQFLQPFSVDAMTGFRNLTFLERSLPFLAFVPFRRIGVGASVLSDDQMTGLGYSVYRTGGFNNNPLGDNRYATDIGDIGGYSFSSRVTHLLWYDDLANDRYLWHVGGGYNYSQIGANTGATSGASGQAGGGTSPFYQATVLPEFGPLGYSENSQSFGNATNATPRIADTGRYQADSFHLFGLESLAQWGAWAFTGEYMGTQVNSIVGPVFYQGGYVQAAYHITGEHRVYDKRTGSLGRLVPYTDFIPLRRGGVAGWGAWEVGARLSAVDLRSPSKLNGHYFVSGTGLYNGATNNGSGEVADTTLGLTWFLNAYTKMQFNYIHCMLNNTGYATPAAGRGFSTMDLFVTRAQVEF
jgi:phosphate-selective porin OprO/OprP